MFFVNPSFFRGQIKGKSQGRILVSLGDMGDIWSDVVDVVVVVGGVVVVVVGVVVYVLFASVSC